MLIVNLIMDKMEKNLLVCVLVWLINMSLVASSNKLTISGLKNQLVSLGHSTTLTCHTQVDHDTCLFKPPGKARERFDSTKKSGRIIYHGEDELKDCGIKITKVEEEDHGQWECVVTVEGVDSAEGVGVANVTIQDLPGEPILNSQTVEVSGTKTDLDLENFVETDEEVTIISHFISNPQVTQVVWNLNDDARIVTINATDHTETLSQASTAYVNRYSASLDSGLEAWQYIAKLTIHKVHKTDLDSINKIVIKNARGETELSFTLVEAIGGGGKVGIIVALVALVVVGIIVALVIGYLVKSGRICAGEEANEGQREGVHVQSELIMNRL